MFAVGASNQEVTKELIKAGADVNARNDFGYTALKYARTPEIKKILIDAGADANIETGKPAPDTVPAEKSKENDAESAKVTPSMPLSPAEQKEYEFIRKRFLDNEHLLNGVGYTLGHSADSKDDVKAMEKVMMLYVTFFDAKQIPKLVEAGGIKGFKKELAGLLTCKDPVMRGSAAIFLGLVDDPAYNADIAKLLADKPGPVPEEIVKKHVYNFDRALAAKALGLLGAREYAPRLAELLQSKDEYDRTGAAIGLGGMKDKAYAPAIAKRLSDKNEPMQVPDLSPAGGLDPAAPGPIPALASCWLYNHRTRLAADAGHPYPPAPAEQVRADHAAPADCCTVESSPDGRRILVFGAPAVPQPETEPVTPATPPRQLLALYDVTTRQCWSANLAVDGQLGRAPYDGLGDPVFSPDGRHLGYRARRGDARFVVVDDREGAVFHRVGAPVFSADGRHSAYWARDRGREFIVFDGTPGRTWIGAGAPVFSPAGGPPAYRAQDAKGWRAVVADTPGSLYDDIGWFNADATGRTTAIADLVFSAKGELAYAARTGEDWFMVRDHRHGPAYDQVGLPVFSPDGTRLAFRARRNARD